MLTIIDDFSRKVWVFFLKQKGYVFSTFKDWKTVIEKQTGRQVKCLHIDNGLEFCSDEFNTLCKKAGSYNSSYSIIKWCSRAYE